MSDPFSGMPDPESPRPIRRPSQPGPLQEAFRAIQASLRTRLPAAQRALGRAQRIAKAELWLAQRSAKDRLGRAQRVAKDGLRRSQRYGNELWYRGKRHPRTAAAVGGAITLTLVGAIALSASGAGRSLCPPTGKGKTPQFRLLMDSVPQAVTGSDLRIHYDVCGLASGSPFQARIRLVPQKAPGKKKSPKAKPMVTSFKDQADGVATRRHEQLELGSTKPGVYTLELSVKDGRGRERTRVQKVVVRR
ncbi:MAG: hypothetical protein ABI703_12165 [Gemmatimonadales bacterium]